MKPYFESLLDEAKSRYKDNLHVMGMTKCLYEMEKFTWKENQLTGPPAISGPLYLFSGLPRAVHAWKAQEL